MEDTYENAYVEVLEILKYISKTEAEKIPKEEFEFFEKNKNADYEYHYNFDNPKMLRKTNVIFISLYRNYLATVEEKKKLDEILILNEQRNNLEKKKTFENKPLFEKHLITDNVAEQTALIVKKKENWIEKVILKIKRFFKLK